MNTNEIKKQNIFKILTIIFLAIYVFLSLNPWITWYLPIKVFCVFISIICYIFFTIEKISVIKIKNTDVITIFFFCIIVIYSNCIKSVFSISSLFVSFYTIIPLFIYFTLNEREKKLFVEFIINIFYYILVISFLLYVFVVFGKISLPFTYLSHPLKNAYEFPFKNYFLLLVSDIPIRFQSIFTEPGHLGMILSFLLYLEKYNFHKKEVIVFFITSLFTFSLAAYLLIIFGYVLFVLSKSRHFLRNILILFVSGLMLLNGANMFYKKNPNALVSTLILSRLQYSEKRGISGNNRTSYDFDNKYMKLTSKQKMVGLGTVGVANYFDKTGTSYKVYIATYGYIGLFILFFCFIIYGLRKKNKYSIGCCLLFSVSFLQRPYILWPIETFLFFLIIDLNKDG